MSRNIVSYTICILYVLCKIVTIIKMGIPLWNCQSYDNTDYYDNHNNHNNHDNSNGNSNTKYDKSY